MIRQIGLLTSGGDAPGMNAAIRAVTRGALQRGWSVYGFSHGYAGLLDDEAIPLDARSVGGIIQQGGTILGSARCPRFKSGAGRQEALETLEREKIDALVVIGGNGSQTGAHLLSEAGFPVVGIASTIDNDLFGAEISVGVDTALNTALEAIDRLKTTASSHHRAFLVEVMGRDCGYLALIIGITGGAEAIVVPEFESDPESIALELEEAYRLGKTHALVVVAEGARNNGQRLAQYFEAHHARLGFELRLTVLGHVQRGGNPSAFDRLLATKSGIAAIETLAAGRHGVMIGLRGTELTETPLSVVTSRRKPLSADLLAMARTLAT